MANFSRQRARSYWAGIALLPLLSACGGGDSSTSRPAATSADGGDTTANDDGAALYQSFCAECHGADLRGTAKGPSHLSIIYEPSHHSDDAFKAAAIRGAPEHHFNFGNMPPVDGITDDQIDRVIAFVRAEQERRGFEG